MRQLAVVVLIALVATTELHASDDTQPPEPKPVTIAIELLGFFNNEHRSQFAPAPIRYVSVNLRDAHDKWTTKLRALPVAVPLVVLTWDETLAMMYHGLSDPELGRQRLMDVLRVLDTAIQERSVPVKKAVTLKPLHVLPQRWGTDDRLLLVVGLETIRGDNPDHTLTSALGCFWFTGEGSYAALLTVPYDFTKLDTEGLVAAMDRCLPQQEQE